MSPAEQEQRVMCEVLRALGYDVEMRATAVTGTPVCCWTDGIPDYTDHVWIALYVWGPGSDAGPLCDTPEEAIAWIVANVPRPQDRSATEVAPTLPPDPAAVGD